MNKKYLFIIWILILNSSNHFGFSKNYIEDEIFKKSENLTIKNKLILKENSNNLSKLLNKTFKYLAENIESISRDNNNNLEAAEIFSDNQINNDKNIIAEGNVLIVYKNMILTSDKLEYNRDEKLIRIEGNINFKSNEQFIEASKIEYDFRKKEGFIKDAYGRINFETLNNITKKIDLEINKNEFQNIDKSIRNVRLQNSSSISIREFGVGNEENSSLDQRLTQKLDTDINEMPNWRFLSERIEIKMIYGLQRNYY